MKVLVYGAGGCALHPGREALRAPSPCFPMTVWNSLPDGGQEANGDAAI